MKNTGESRNPRWEEERRADRLTVQKERTED